LPISLEDALRDFGSRRWRDVLAAIETRIGHQIPDELIIQQYKRMQKRVTLEVGTMPGVEAFLDLTAGVPRAIAASSELGWIEQSIARFGLQPHFGEHVYTTATLCLDKPNPEIYTLVAQKLSIAPRRIIAVEDNAVGVSAAIAAGVSVIGFIGGSHILPGDADAMTMAGARMIAEDFEDVADWIGWVS
jgi:HAD superfamily hydrolase (TIGR01509 family)